MKPFVLKAQDMVPVNKTAFQQSAHTQLLSDLIKDPKAVKMALEDTALRFSLVPHNVRAIRVG